MSEGGGDPPAGGFGEPPAEGGGDPPAEGGGVGFEEDGLLEGKGLSLLSSLGGDG